MENNAAEYGIVLTKASSSLRFDELIRALHQRFQKQVVILIDEYNKPIIDYLDQDQLPKARENRGILKSFYSILKDADPYLKLVFITGFGKPTFYELNNLYDISFDQNYNEICGFSQNELETYFPKELEAFDREKIRHWYNGYRWHIKGDTLYNPLSILHFFRKGEFSSYWSAMNTLTLLMEISKKNPLYLFEKIQMSHHGLHSIDLESIYLIVFLYKAGYLTIEDYDTLFDNFILSFPNHEVEVAYFEKLEVA
jgi:hypothetical protein